MFDYDDKEIFLRQGSQCTPPLPDAPSRNFVRDQRQREATNEYPHTCDLTGSIYRFGMLHTDGDSPKQTHASIERSNYCVFSFNPPFLPTRGYNRGYSRSIPSPKTMRVWASTPPRMAMLLDTRQASLNDLHPILLLNSPFFPPIPFAGDNINASRTRTLCEKGMLSNVGAFCDRITVHLKTWPDPVESPHPIIFSNYFRFPSREHGKNRGRFRPIPSPQVRTWVNRYRQGLLNTSSGAAEHPNGHDTVCISPTMR